MRASTIGAALAGHADVAKVAFTGGDATGACVAGSRALIHRSIHDEFVDRFLALAKTARMGDPLDEATQVGPITTIPQYEKVLGYIEIANGTAYGLAAGVWTADIARCLTMAQRLEAGTVWVNTYRVSSPLSPFGGYKRSGFGRESGLLAIREFVHEKSVWIETSGAQVPNPFIVR